MAKRLGDYSHGRVTGAAHRPTRLAIWLLAFAVYERYSCGVRSRRGVTLVEIMVTMLLVVILVLFATSIYPALNRGVGQTRTRLQAQTMASSVATWEGSQWLATQALAVSDGLEVDPATENFSKTCTARELAETYGWSVDVTAGKVVEVQVTTEVCPGLWNKRAAVVARVRWRERAGLQQAETEFRVAPQGAAPTQ